MDLSDQRINYEVDGIDFAGLHDDPVVQFRSWFDEVAATDEREPYAMVLSTVDEKGRPSGRNVLLRAVDHGWVFYTNYTSAKAIALESSGVGALTFSWLSMHRQVHIEGSVERVSEAESDAYFAKRPRGSQLGAWASDQSAPISSRDALQKRLDDVTERFAGGEVSRPPFWGGYRLIPDRVEFWQGQPSRLHDRLRYTRMGDLWEQGRLSP